LNSFKRKTFSILELSASNLEPVYAHFLNEAFLGK